MGSKVRFAWVGADSKADFYRCQRCGYRVEVPKMQNQRPAKPKCCPACSGKSVRCHPG